MTDRDRLIELLHKAEDKCESTHDCDDCKYILSGSCKTVLIADYLLANGVIVPPCKVGDTVYRVLSSGEMVALEVTGFHCAVITNPYNVISFEFLNTKSFLTKEEAEEKLKEREG